MGNYKSFSFYSDVSGNAATAWMQPGKTPANPSDQFWFDPSGNFNVAAGENIPGPVAIGSNSITANNLAQLTADANFAGTVYLTAPVTLTANLTTTCDLRALNGAVITLGAYNLAINGPFEAGNYQCFNVNGSGLVSFGNYSKPLSVAWWGARGDAVRTACSTTAGSNVITCSLELPLRARM